MYEVMPFISEDNISQRSSQFNGDDVNFEQLVVSMLDERDKLMDSLLKEQINANLPQVRLFFSLTQIRTFVVIFFVKLD